MIACGSRAPSCVADRAAVPLAMIPIQIASAWRGTSDCRNCGIRDMVLFADLNERDFSLIHAPVDDLEIRAGDVLHAEGDTARVAIGLSAAVKRGNACVQPSGRVRAARRSSSGCCVREMWWAWRPWPLHVMTARRLP